MEAETVFKASLGLSVIGQHENEIIEAVEQHDVTVLVAPTGVGKSSEIPPLLLGIAELVVVTQPRRVAAESLAQHVAQKMSSELGDLVGFQTAFKSELSENTRIIYCTDGIETLRQLYGAYTPDNTVFVIDEVHEWSLNIEVLVAWFKKQQNDGKSIKLVLLSATLEADLLAGHFENSTVVSCEGVSHPVEEIQHKGNVASAAVRMLEEGHNVLVFVPGKAEIKKTIKKITETGVIAKCLPFHADLGSDDVEWVFESFAEPKCIVATTIAQTSITIPDIDAVVDSGLERGTEYVDGVEGLYTRPVSLAERQQRKGRAGRTKRGFYIDCLPIPPEERDIFSVPSIQRQELSGMVLQVVAAGYAPEALPFFHHPKPQQLDDARDTLRYIGFLDEDDRVTEMGRKAAKLPVQPRAARMLLEAVDRDGVVDYNAVTLATIFEYKKDLWFREESGRELFPGSYVEKGVSDVFDRIKTFDAAAQLPPHLLYEYGIEPSSFERLKEQRAVLVDRLIRLGYEVSRPHRVLDARHVIAGLSDLVFIRSLVSSEYRREGQDSAPRKTHSGSTITNSRVVGLPWNFERYSKFGPVVERRLLWVTALPS